MKRRSILWLLLVCAACGNNTSEQEALKAEIDSVRREYEGARQELFLKRDSAKKVDLSGDSAFQARLKAAEVRSAALKQESGRKKSEFRTRKQTTTPRESSPNTQ